MKLPTGGLDSTLLSHRRRVRWMVAGAALGALVGATARLAGLDPSWSAVPIGAGAGIGIGAAMG